MTMRHLKTICRLCLAMMLLAAHMDLYAQQANKQITSEWRDGDYIVRRYLVSDNHPHNTEYEIHYAINSAKAVAEYEDNGAEISRLDTFFSQLSNDSLLHISKITISGYASPDGTTASNTKLAHQRAEQLGYMLAERYGLNDYNIAINSYVEPWSATTMAIETSELEDRDNIADIVNSSEPPMTIDNRLKHEREAWDWLTTNVLPDMRRSVITITYTKDKMMDSREYKPIANTPQEVVVTEVIVENKKHHKENKHKEKRHRNIIVINEWEGVIIDMGATDEGTSN